jgi:hypothetical protein
MWSVTLGGQTVGGSQSVGVDFSTDGVSYSPVGSFMFTTTDTAFSAALGAGPSPMAFLRLNFGSQANGQALLDNVTILADTVPVPEPGTAAMLLLGLAGLAINGRRRSA